MATHSAKIRAEMLMLNGSIYWGGGGGRKQTRQEQENKTDKSKKNKLL